MSQHNEMDSLRTQLTTLTAQVGRIERAVIGEEATGQVGLVSKVDSNMVRIEEVNDSFADYKHKDEIRMAKFSGIIIAAGIAVELIKAGWLGLLHG